jgi:hypothetical protein
MNKLLQLKNCTGNYDLIGFLQDKNFFDLFNNSNGFVIIVEVIGNEDNIAIESMKTSLEMNIKKAVLVQVKSSKNQTVMTLIKDSVTDTLEILDLKIVIKPSSDSSETFTSMAIFYLNFRLLKKSSLSILRQLIILL